MLSGKLCSTVLCMRMHTHTQTRKHEQQQPGRNDAPEACWKQFTQYRMEPSGRERCLRLGGAGGVSQVGQQVLKRGLLGHQRLDIEAQHGHHGQPPVLDLLHLQLSERVWVVGQTQGVERATGVQAVQILAEITHAATRAVRLHGAHDGQGGQERRPQAFASDGHALTGNIGMFGRNALSAVVEKTNEIKTETEWKI